MNLERKTMVGALKEIFEDNSKMIVDSFVLDLSADELIVFSDDTVVALELCVIRICEDTDMLIRDSIRDTYDIGDKTSTIELYSEAVGSEEHGIGFPIGYFGDDLRSYPEIIRNDYLVWTREDFEEYFKEKLEELE